jgi:hypothetical protein
MKAGSSMPARVVVQNDTGRAISAYGCGTLFAIGLVNGTFRQQMAYPLCRQRASAPDSCR